MKQKILLLAAVIFGVLAFMLTFQQLNHEKQKIRSMAREVVLLKAVRDISENEIITEDAIRMTKEKRFSEQLSGSRDVLAEQKNLIIGRKVQFPIMKGNIIQWNDLQTTTSTGQGVTRMIRPDYRAVSISVDRTSSVSGLVQPNDYVDLIGTFRFPDNRGDSSMDTVTLTILQKVRVIATGSDYGTRPAGSRSSYGTVTLELLPKEVEMIIFATQKGRVQLSLRNYEDAQFTREVQSVNWKFLQENIGKYMEERERHTRGAGGR